MRVDAQVLLGKRPLYGLTQEDFVVSDEGQPQKIVYFRQGNDPLSLVLLLDISGSMQKWIERISGVAHEALDNLRPGDRVAILVFAKDVAVHQDFSDNLAETARQIAGAVHNHDVGTSTAINKAIVDASDYLQKNAGHDDRRAILILTDNLSMSYQLTNRQVVRKLYDTDTVLNAMVVGRAIRPSPPVPGKIVNPDYSPADVFELAEQTGGDAEKVDSPDLTFKEMIELIRNRYSLSYHAPEGQPGSLRHIDVVLSDSARRKFPLAEIHARHGYYLTP